MNQLQSFSFSRMATAFLLGSMLAACSSMGPEAGAAPAKMQDGVLVGKSGMTLYVFDKDADGKSMCNDKCAENWPPLYAEGTVSGDFGVISRNDGKKQVTYKGRPLYYWIKDQKPGDKTGDGVNNNLWHVAK